MRLPQKPQNEIVVAKMNGDERRIQQAINRVSDVASATSEQAVNVKPGVYSEESYNGVADSLYVPDYVTVYADALGLVTVDANVTLAANASMYNIILSDGRTLTEE